MNMTRAARKAHKAHARRRGRYTMMDGSSTCVAVSNKKQNKINRQKKQDAFYQRIQARRKG